MNRLIYALGLLLCVAAAGAGEPMKVWVNPQGYALVGPKRATVIGHRGDEVSAWRIICTSCGKVFARGVTPPMRNIEKDQVEWTIDFSAMDVEDEVVLECDTNRGTLSSEAFMVGMNQPTTRANE